MIYEGIVMSDLFIIGNYLELASVIGKKRIWNAWLKNIWIY